MRRRPIILVSVVAVAALGLLAAGCGGGGGSPGVANLGTDAAVTTPGTTTQSTGSGTKALGGGPRIGPTGHFAIGMAVGTKDGPKFSACMRTHGIASFPDPNSQGVISIQSGMGIDPQSPAFQ